MSGFSHARRPAEVALGLLFLVKQLFKSWIDAEYRTSLAVARADTRIQRVERRCPTAPGVVALTALVGKSWLIGRAHAVMFSFARTMSGAVGRRSRNPLGRPGYAGDRVR